MQFGLCLLLDVAHANLLSPTNMVSIMSYTFANAQLQVFFTSAIPFMKHLTQDYHLPACSYGIRVDILHLIGVNGVERKLCITCCSAATLPSRHSSAAAFVTSLHLCTWSQAASATACTSLLWFEHNRDHHLNSCSVTKPCFP